MAENMAHDIQEPGAAGFASGVRTKGTSVGAVKAYLDWQEEEVLLGNVHPTIDQYAEHLRVKDLEDRLAQILDLASSEIPDHKGGFMGDAEKLSLIANLADWEA